MLKGDLEANILLVEDDASFAELVRAQLRRMPSVQSHLEVASTLTEARAKLAAASFGVVVADLNLPDSRGLATLDALSAGGTQLVIVLTAEDTPALRSEAIEHGAFDLLCKQQLGAADLERLVRIAAQQAASLRMLRESEARFAGLIQLSSDFYWESDSQHRVVKTEHGETHHPAVNPGQLGRARWELPSTHPDAEGWAAHRATMQAHLPFRDFEIARLDEDGTERWRSISGEPVFDAGGAFQGYRGVGTDITAGKRAEEELRRFRLAMDNSADLIVLIDRTTMRFVDVNRTTCERLGYSREELLAFGPQDILPVMREQLEKSYDALIADPAQVGSMESHYRCKDGTLLPFEATRHVLRSGKDWVIAAVSRDIRERVAAEQRVAGLRRMYAALGAANEAILRARSTQEVFERTCQIAVDAGGFLVGTVFTIDEGGRTLTRAAASGSAASMAEQVAPSVDATRPEGGGLIGEACRTRQPAISNDYPADPRSATSRGIARGYAVGSAAVFPLNVEGDLVGVLGLQHADRDAFGDEMTALLQRLADNIAFALENFRRDSRRRQAEHGLAESESRFRSLLGLSSDMYWEQDEEYRFTVLSDSGPVWLDGARRNRLVGKRRWDQHYFNMTDADWAQHKSLLDARKPFDDLELGRINEVGDEVWVRVGGEPVFDESGRFRGYRGIGKDITERRRAAKLRDLEHSVTRSLAQAASLDDALRETIRGTCETFGWECGRYFAPDAQGSKLGLVAAWGVQEEAVQRYIAGCRGFTYPRGAGLAGRVWQTGQTVWVEDILQDSRAAQPALARDSGMRGAFFFPVLADGETIGVFAFNSRSVRRPDEALLQAIGVIGSQVGQYLQRKLAEARLAQSEARFRQTFEIAASGIAHTDLQGRFLQVNRRLCEMLGYGEAELVGRSVKDISHPEVRDATDAQRQRMRAGEIDSVAFEKRYLRKDGSLLWVYLTVALARDAAGEPQYEISVIDDITERKQAEGALRESEERFRALTQLTADVYWEQDASYRFTSVTPNPRRRTRLGPEGLMGKTRWEVDYVNMTPVDWAAHVARLDAREAFYDLEICREVDGSKLWFSTSGGPVFDARGAFLGYRGVSYDITERKREEALLRLEHAVTRRLSEADSTSSALLEVIREICQSEGWSCGRYFALDEEARLLRFAEAWGEARPEVQAFLERSRRTVYRRGEGLSGWCWEHQEPLWAPDATTDPRAKGTARSPAGALIGGSVALPVLSGGDTLGVMSFSRSDPVQPEPRLLQSLVVIASQVGQYLRRKRSEEVTRRDEEELRRFRAAMDMSLDAIYLTDRSTMRFVDVNQIGCKWLGYAREDLLRLGPHDVLPSSREELEREYDAVIAEGARALRIETSFAAKDGRRGWTELHRRALREGDRWIIVTISRDITERKLAEERQAQHLRHQERIARFGQSAIARREPGELVEEAVQNVLEGLAADAVAYVEPAASSNALVLRTLVGVAGEGAQGALIAAGAAAPIAEVLRTGNRMLLGEGALGLPWAAGLASVALVPVRGESGVRGVLCAACRPADAFGAQTLNFIEATTGVLSTGLQRIDSEGRLTYLAQFDALTGLPNRALLADRFSQMIVQARRRDAGLGVLFIDLDEFKTVNDTLGHAGGDELLKEAAARLQSCVRSGDTVARISGDEFAVVLADLAQPEDAALVAQKVIDRIGAACSIRGHEVFVTASVGIAAFPGDGADAESLIGAADAAMYRAKQSGRNAYQFFTAEINQRSRTRAQMGSDLRRALEREEFVLVYQPKYRLADRSMCGAEALLRWRHPERGTVSPVEFIPVLEESGLIVPVGEWVLRRACEDLKAWRAAGFEPGPIAVNLSARQFRLPDLDARIKALIAAAGVDPGLIELEITESQLMQDPDQAIGVMRSLDNTGIRIAIDDFGTGYSSLSYLTRFPVRSLKIDRSFVADVNDDPQDAAIVRTIIEMAHTLGFTVVAEGIETEAQAEYLRQHGCEQGQGFLFARPMPAADLPHSSLARIRPAGRPARRRANRA